MATKEIKIAGVGPLQYDDTDPDTPSALDIDGDIALTGLTANRLVEANASNIMASADLINFIASVSGSAIEVADDAAGGVILDVKHIYGEMYDNAVARTLTISSAGAEYLVPIGSLGSLSNVVAGSVTGRLKASITGYFNVIASVTFHMATAGGVTIGAVMKTYNPTTYTFYTKSKSRQRLYIPDTNVYTMTVHMNIKLTVGGDSEIGLYITNETNTEDIIIDEANFLMIGV